MTSFRPPARCLTCKRQLLPRQKWEALPEPDRKRLSRRLAPHAALGYCKTHYAKSDGQIAYRGGWQRVGHVLIPIVGGQPLAAFGEAS